MYIKVRVYKTPPVSKQKGHNEDLKVGKRDPDFRVRHRREAKENPRIKMKKRFQDALTIWLSG